MKNYQRIMAGPKSVYSKQCFDEGFIGVDFNIPKDFSGLWGDEWRAFNKKYIPFYLENNPQKSKIAAGLACGMLWTFGKGLNIGDVIFCPDGIGNYYVGEIDSDYYYKENGILPHRRKVKWRQEPLDRSITSDVLQNSAGAISTSISLTKHADEIESLISKDTQPKIIVNDSTIENPSAFALEKHLEDFLVQNWNHTELGKNYDIYSEDGEILGQQFPSDTGPIDILAISKNRKELLVVELKKGRVSDVVVGQIQRYMGYVQDELAETNQTVKGLIIGLEDDIKLRRALSVTQNIEFYTYQINFQLNK